MSVLPNHIIVQNFKDSIVNLISLYAECTGKIVKATMMRAKLNLDTVGVLRKVRPYVLDHAEYVDSGDIDAFMLANSHPAMYSNNLASLLKIVRVVRENSQGDDLVNIMQQIRDIKSACELYQDEYDTLDE
jgi:hypothetical protein